MAITYDAISTTTLGSNQSVVSFTGIPATYTDLRLISNVRETNASQYIYLTVNGDTASNYSDFNLFRTSPGVGSSVNSNETQIYPVYTGGGITTAADLFTFTIMDFFSYANTSVFKPIMVRTGNTNTSTELGGGMWRSTSAITTITLTASAFNFVTGSSFSLYGIKAA